MHASCFQSLPRGGVFVGGLRAITVALSLLPALTVSAQEADGDFEGEKTWTDKVGNVREIKAPSPRDKNRQRLMTIVREGKWTADAEEEMVRDWLEFYVRSITWKEHLANLHSVRKELKKQLINTGKAPAADLHKRLNDMTLKVCTEVAQDPRYPRAVRYNCMLMLGELDEREYNSNTGDTAVPLPAATTEMLDTVADAKQHLFIRLAAVIGLKRHAQLGIAPALQGRVADTLLGVLQKPAAEGKVAIGQVWLRFVVADLLHAMIEKKIAVDQAKLATALAALIDDEASPTWARAKLAGELGKLNGASVPPAQILPTVKVLAGLMLAISQASPFAVDETAAAMEDNAQKATEKKSTDKKVADKKATDKKATDKKTTDKKTADRSDPKKSDKAEPASASAATEAPSPTVQKLSSEEMIWQLSQIRLALYGKDAPAGKEKGPDAALGLYSAADDVTKKIIGKIVGHIDEIVKSAAGVPDAKDVLNKLADTLRTANQDLEDLLSGPTAEAAEAPSVPKPVAGRARPPQGNAPPNASTTAP